MKEASIYISGNLMPDTAVVQADHYRKTFLELMAAIKREDQLRADRDDDAKTFNLALEKLQRNEAELREELDKVRDLHSQQCCVFCNDTGNLRSVNAELQQRLTVAEQFVQKMVDCTKGQDSVATGYLSDILDMIKGNSL